VEGKEFLMRQASSTTTHSPLRTKADNDATRKAILNYLFAIVGQH
jgi:hypothetical protein